MDTPIVCMAKMSLTVVSPLVVVSATSFSAKKTANVYNGTTHAHQDVQRKYALVKNLNFLSAVDSELFRQ